MELDTFQPTVHNYFNGFPKGLEGPMPRKSHPPFGRSTTTIQKKLDQDLPMLPYCLNQHDKLVPQITCILPAFFFFLSNASKLDLNMLGLDSPATSCSSIAKICHHLPEFGILWHRILDVKGFNIDGYWVPWWCYILIKVHPLLSLLFHGVIA